MGDVIDFGMVKKKKERRPLLGELLAKMSSPTIHRDSHGMTWVVDADKPLPEFLREDEK